MTVQYAVTFEFESRPAVTHRGTVGASSGATCVARATRIAQRALRPVNWTSLVCVAPGAAGSAGVGDAAAPRSRAAGGGLRGEVCQPFD